MSATRTGPTVAAPAESPLGPPTRIDRDGRRYDVVRAWPRGTDHVLLELTSPDGATVAGQWCADPDALERRAAAAPAPAHVVGDVLIQPDGADAELPALAGLLARPGARLVAHRPGRRAVVELPGDADGPPAFAKVVRPGRARDVARRGALVAELLDASVPDDGGHLHVAVPRLLDGSREEEGVLLWSVVPGRTLHDLGSDAAWGPDRAHDAWRAAGRATSRLHGARRAAVTDRHGAADELAAIDHWLVPAVRHGLLEAEPAAWARAHVATVLAEVPAAADLGVLHRDLHDKQLLLPPDGSGIGMIDVDTLAVGEREVDVANVLVHLELRRAQGLIGPDVAAAAREGFLAGATGTDPARVAAYSEATRLRLAGVYAYRPRWHAVAADLLAQVAAR